MRVHIHIHIHMHINPDLNQYHKPCHSNVFSPVGKPLKTAWDLLGMPKEVARRIILEDRPAWDATHVPFVVDPMFTHGGDTHGPETFVVDRVIIYYHPGTDFVTRNPTVG